MQRRCLQIPNSGLEISATHHRLAVGHGYHRFLWGFPGESCWRPLTE